MKSKNKFSLSGDLFQDIIISGSNNCSSDSNLEQKTSSSSNNKNINNNNSHYGSSYRRKFWSCVRLGSRSPYQDGAILRQRITKQSYKPDFRNPSKTSNQLRSDRRDGRRGSSTPPEHNRKNFQRHYTQTTEVLQRNQKNRRTLEDAQSPSDNQNRNGNSVIVITTNRSPHISSKTQEPNRNRTTHIYLLLSVMSVLIYANGLQGEYVHDDLSAVINNPDVQGGRPWWNIFVNDFWGKAMADPASHKSYRPLTILTFRITHLMWGNNYVLDHCVNVVLHVGVTLFYAHTLLSTLNLTHAHTLVSGLLFAVHPIHTEAVTGIVGRADLLAAGAFLASFTAYHRCLVSQNGGGEVVWVWWASVGAVVGVLCKEHALTVLALCVAWDIALNAHTIRRYMLRREGAHTTLPLTRRMGRMLCLGLVIMSLRLLLMRSPPVFSDQDNPAAFAKSTLTRFLTFLYLPAHNTWLLLYPSELSYDWQLGSIPLVSSLSDLRNLSSVALYGCLLMVFMAACRMRGREGEAVLWSLLVLCLPFVPASNVFFTVGFVVAERLLYIPSLGWCTLMGLGAVRVCDAVTWRALRRLLVAVVVIFCVRTIRRNLDWRSRETLFTSGLRTLPHNAKIHYNFANLQKDMQRSEVAIAHYKEAIRLWWTYPSAHNNLGTVLLQKGQHQQAEGHFAMALHAHPTHAHAALNLATLWGKQGRTQQAISLLESIFAPEDEDSVGPGRLLAELLLQEGRRREAEEVYLSLLTAQPHNPHVLADYASFMYNQGRSESAARHYEAALSLDPTHTRALTGYASLLEAREHHARAHDLYSRALAGGWEPDTATSLARVCLQTGQLSQAEQLLTRVTRCHPAHLPARVHLAQVKLQQKKYRESENILQGILAETPHHREALYHLSLLFSTTNRSQQAVEAAMGAARECKHPKELCALLHAHHADLLHTHSLMDAAVTSYQQAVSLEPTLSRAHLNLGVIYHTQGRYNLAWEHYRTALTHDPANDLLQENMQKLSKVMKTPNKS